MSDSDPLPLAKGSFTPSEAPPGDSEEWISAELSATRLLHSLSTDLVREDDFQRLLERITGAALEIMRSNFASMQLVQRVEASDSDNPAGLELLTFRGFDPKAAGYWRWVPLDAVSPCGRAFRSGRRVVVGDVEVCERIAESMDLEMFRRNGIRSVQSTPLRSRGATCWVC